MNNCGKCGFWIADKFDAIGMGWCRCNVLHRNTNVNDRCRHFARHNAVGISYQCSIYTCNGCGDVYEYEDGKLDNTGAFTCKQCLMIKRLMNLNAAEVAFSGLGLFDVFRPTKGERVYVGSVLLDLDNPPFFVGDGIYFKYAPGFVLFPRGVVGLTPVVADRAIAPASGEDCSTRAAAKP